MKVPVYKDPALIRRIYDLRTEGAPFQVISTTINEEYGTNITPPTTKAIYNRYVAKQLLVNAESEKIEAGEIAPDFQKKMDERFDRIAKVTDELMDLMQQLKKDLPSEEYVKYIPTVLMVSREILNQLAFIKKDQSQILVNQKNMIYSPLQIMQVLNKEIVKLEEDGKVKFNPIRSEPNRITKLGLRAAHNRLGGESGRLFTENEKANIVFEEPKTGEEIEADNQEDEIEVVK
jgi:hypothetical protein